MARLYAQSAEIVGRGDDAAAEEVVPDAVDDDAAGQGIVRAKQAFGQFQAAALVGLVGRVVDGVEKAAGNGIERFFVVSALEERLILATPFGQGWDPRGDGNLCFQASVFLDERLGGGEFGKRVRQRAGFQRVTEEPGLWVG